DALGDERQESRATRSEAIRSALAPRAIARCALPRSTVDRARPATATREWVASLARPRPGTSAPRVPYPTARGERSQAEAKRSQRATHNHTLPTRPPFVASRCRSVARAPTAQRLCSFLSFSVGASDQPLDVDTSKTCPLRQTPATTGPDTPDL